MGGEQSRSIFKGVFTNMEYATNNENPECKACLATWQSKLCTPIGLFSKELTDGK